MAVLDLRRFLLDPVGTGATAYHKGRGGGREGRSGGRAVSVSADVCSQLRSASWSTATDDNRRSDMYLPILLVTFEAFSEQPDGERPILVIYEFREN